MNEKEFYDLIGGNYGEALERLMNDTLIHKFILKFKDDLSFEKLEIAIKNENINEAFLQSHTLKGVSLNLAFSKLSEALITLTDSLREENRENFNYPKVLTEFDAVKKEYLKVIDAIEKLN